MDDPYDKGMSFEYKDKYFFYLIVNFGLIQILRNVKILNINIL